VEADITADEERSPNHRRTQHRYCSPAGSQPGAESKVTVRKANLRPQLFLLLLRQVVAIKLSADKTIISDKIISAPDNIAHNNNIAHNDLGDAIGLLKALATQSRQSVVPAPSP
jgi:hypothetical protein